MNNARWGKTLSFLTTSTARLWRGRLYERRAQRPDDLDPLRAELFSADQMEYFGKHLASQHQLSKTRTRDRLLTRLDDNEQVLINACSPPPLKPARGLPRQVNGCSITFT